MTQPDNKITVLKRVARVAVVALCTVVGAAASLALFGAVPAKWSSNRTPAKSISSKVVATEAFTAKPASAARRVEVELASFTTRPQLQAGVEMLQDAKATPALLPAASTVRTRVVRMEVTAYCPCVKCCGPNAQGITASGKLVSFNDGKFVAADTSVLPFGKRLVVPGYADDQPVEVADRGGAIKGKRLDLYFHSHAEALVWGRQQLDVTIYE